MVKLVKSIFILALCVSSIGLTSGEPERIATLELLDTMQFEKTINQSIDCSIEMIKKMVPEGDKTEEIIAKFFTQLFKMESMREKMVEIYSEIYTEEEIKDMTAFYKSKTGQKVLEKMPEIMQRSMELTQSRLGQNMDQLFIMLDEELGKQKNNLEL